MTRWSQLPQIGNEKLTPSGRPSRAAEGFTRREVLIVRELCTGAANKEIAARLGLTLGSVKVYLYRIFCKVGVHTRVELILWCNRQQGVNMNDRPAVHLAGLGFAEPAD